VIRTLIVCGMSFRVACLGTLTLLCQFTARSEPQYRIAFNSLAPRNQAIFIADGDGGNAKPLAPHAAFNWNASFSGDGRWVVFTSDRAGSADLFRIHPDGSGLERLTDSPAFDDQAAFSPDGASIAFVSSRSGQADIWILNLKTRKLVNLTNHPEGDFRPAWSPDGRWIAFSSDRDSKHPMVGFTLRHSTEIYAVQPDGTELRRVTNGNAFAGTPAWSADSSLLLFYEAGLDQRVSGGQGTTQIVSVDFQTGRREVLTSGEGIKLFPRSLEKGRVGYLAPGVVPLGGLGGWSGKFDNPDGSIRFTSGAAGTSGGFNSPHWSADGKRMVFHRATELNPVSVKEWASPDSRFGLLRIELLIPSYSPDGDRVTGSGALEPNAGTKGAFVMNADGGERRLIHENKDGLVFGMAWSPLGDRIVFSVGAFFAQAASGPAHLAMIRPDGTDLKMLTSGKRNDGFPSWSPDGKRLVFRSVTAQRRGINIMDIESGTITPLATGSEWDTFPAWSPRGDLISFTSNRDGDYEIYVIRADGTGLRRLTNARGNDAHATWSPDGEWIAFSTSRQGFKDEGALQVGNFQPYGEVCVMRKDGSDIHVLTDNPWEEGAVSWIPSRRK
jgi:TolB protein